MLIMSYARMCAFLYAHPWFEGRNSTVASYHYQCCLLLRFYFRFTIIPVLKYIIFDFAVIISYYIVELL